MRDRLTRYIFVSHDENDPTGLLEVDHEEGGRGRGGGQEIGARHPRGTVKRYLGNDWLKEAQDKGVLSPDEADLLRYTERLVAKVIAVDDFDAEAVKPHYAPGDNARAVLERRPRRSPRSARGGVVSVIARGGAPKQSRAMRCCA